MSANTDENGQARSLVIGGTGLVGGYIVEHLVRRGELPFALSRSQQARAGAEWFRGDLEQPDTLKFSAFATLYCTADAVLLADALPRLFQPSLRQVVAFGSTKRAHQAGHRRCGRTRHHPKARRR